MPANSRIKVKLLITMLGNIALATTSASAESLKAFATRHGNLVGAGTGVAVALNDSGATSITFSTGTQINRLIKITYNAECAVVGPNQAWVSVTVLVDGVEANPASGRGFALCTAGPNGLSYYQWTGAVRQSLIKVPTAGTHTLQIIVDLNVG